MVIRQMERTTLPDRGRVALRLLPILLRSEAFRRRYLQLTSTWLPVCLCHLRKRPLDRVLKPFLHDRLNHVIVGVDIECGQGILPV
jgi:hypothetical protein